MKNPQLRWALLCVTAACGTFATCPAIADQTVKLGSKDTVETLAHKFHVTPGAICRANSITPETILRTGRTLVIPAAPPVIKKPASEKTIARIHGNRIGVRKGPGANYLRVTLVDQGTAVLISHREAGWVQVRLENDKFGWVKDEFVEFAKPGKSIRFVRDSSSGSKSTKSRVARRSSRDDDEELTVRKSRNRRYSSSLRRRRSNGGSYRSEPDLPKTNNQVIRTALNYRGTAYKFGGTGKRGFDCSGFTSFVYRKEGVSLPHSSREQFSHGKKVVKEALKPGDLVFFHTSRKGISHVGIYAGEGKFVHAANTRGKVRVDSLNSGYYNNRYVGARRVK